MLTDFPETGCNIEFSHLDIGMLVLNRRYFSKMHVHVDAVKIS